MSLQTFFRQLDRIDPAICGDKQADHDEQHEGERFGNREKILNPFAG